jgi:hypothetical protein
MAKVKAELVAETKQESTPEQIDETPMSIKKPKAFSLDRFKTKGDAKLPNVETLLPALPHHNIAQAGDFVHLHPDPAYTSPELYFVPVPVPGQPRKVLHLIDENLLGFLPRGRIRRFQLALAATAAGQFFLCEIPSRNLDNSWNKSNVEACGKARTQWTQATSQPDVEAYQVDFSHDPDAFKEPKWPKATLEELIERSFKGFMIPAPEHEEHPENDPALRRLRGMKQQLG